MSKIVLMGDSITEYMPYIFKGTIGTSSDEIKYFGVENIGVGCYMNYAWPRVDHENVDTYILLIGTNNISRPDCDYDGRETLEDLVDKLKEFIDKIITTSPQSRLIVQSIYPTKYPQRSDKIIYVNSKVEEYCNDKGIDYLGLHSILKDDEGLLNKEYSDDGIHPNKEGYDVVAREINKKLCIEKDKQLSLVNHVTTHKKDN